MKSIFVLALILVAMPAHGVEDSPANRDAHALRYLAVASPVEQIAARIEAVAQKLPEDQRALFKQAMARNVDMAGINDEMRKALVEHLTTDELQALADFYTSDAGRSVMKKFGLVMEAVAPVLNGKFREAQQKSFREVALGEDASEPAPSGSPVTAP